MLVELDFRIQLPLQSTAAKETPFPSHLRKIVARDPAARTGLIFNAYVVAGIVANWDFYRGSDTEGAQQALKDLVLIDDNTIAALKDRPYGQIVPVTRLQNVTVVVGVIDSAAELKLAHRTMFWSRLDLKVSSRRSLIKPGHEANLRIEIFPHIKMS